MTKTTTALALLVALLLGALGRDLLLPRAHADSSAFGHGDVEHIVRALESQAKATEELVRVTRECKQR
jgi:hypothetical protein